MARYLIAVKIKAFSASMVIEHGMSIEMASIVPNPITILQAAEQVNNIFKATFGVDLKDGRVKFGVYECG